MAPPLTHLGSIICECVICKMNVLTCSSFIKDPESGLAATLDLHGSSVPALIDWTWPSAAYVPQHSVKRDDFVHAHSQADAYLKQAFHHGLHHDAFPRLLMPRTLCLHCVPIFSSDLAAGEEATMIENLKGAMTRVLLPFGVANVNEIPHAVDRVRRITDVGSSSGIARYWTTWHSSRLVRSFERHASR